MTQLRPKGGEANETKGKGFPERGNNLYKGPVGRQWCGVITEDT